MQPSERSLQAYGPAPSPGPTAYGLCGCKQATVLPRVSVAPLASEGGDTTLRVVLGTGSDVLEVLSTVPAEPSGNSGFGC